MSLSLSRLLFLQEFQFSRPSSSSSQNEPNFDRFSNKGEVALTNHRTWLASTLSPPESVLIFSTSRVHLISWAWPETRSTFTIVNKWSFRFGTRRQTENLFFFAEAAVKHVKLRVAWKKSIFGEIQWSTRYFSIWNIVPRLEFNPLDMKLRQRHSVVYTRR